jgi:hypothetical protein
VKVPLDKIYGDLDFATDRLSSQIRALTAGILALVWVFLSGGKDAPKLGVGSNEPLVLIGGLCILTFLLDALQYWAMFVSADTVRKKAEKLKHTEAEYDEKSFARRVQTWTFWGKQVSCAVSAFWLLAVIVLSVWQ